MVNTLDIKILLMCAKRPCSRQELYEAWPDESQAEITIAVADLIGRGELTRLDDNSIVTNTKDIP